MQAKRSKLEQTDAEDGSNDSKTLNGLLQWIKRDEISISMNKEWVKTLKTYELDDELNTNVIIFHNLLAEKYCNSNSLYPKENVIDACVEFAMNASVQEFTHYDIIDASKQKKAHLSKDYWITRIAGLLAKMPAYWLQ